MAAPATVIGEKEELHVVETENYRIVFTNRGACVHSWILKKYKDIQGKPVELVSSTAAPKVGWPFSYMFLGQKPAVDLNGVLFSVKQPDPSTVEFEYADGTTTAKKSFQFDPKTYKSVFHSDVTSGGKGIAHQLAWRGGFGDRTVHNAPDIQKSVHYDAIKSKLVEEGSGSASKGPVTISGSFHFAGIEDTFFAAVVLPQPGTTTEMTTWQDHVVPVLGAEEKPHVGISIGGKDVNEAILFVGPKDTDVLRATDKNLETMIDWGWFWFIAKPLFLALHWANDNLTNNWGWAIVFATVIINLLMLPMRFRSCAARRRWPSSSPNFKPFRRAIKMCP